MIVARETGLLDRLRTERTLVGGTTPHAELMRINPLGKIPTPVLEDGTAVYDSPVICEYLDTPHGGSKLYPPWPERTCRSTTAETQSSLSLLIQAGRSSA